MLTTGSNYVIIQTMKKLFVFLTMMLIVTSGISQTPLNPPLGLKFGSTPDEVKKEVSSKGTYKTIETATYGKLLTFDDVIVGSTTAQSVMFKFVNNKLFAVTLIYIVENINELQAKYDNLSEIITSKYGQGHSFRTFRYPYDDTADDFAAAVRGGYADISTFWSKMFTGEDGIILELKRYGVTMEYQSGALMSEALEAQKSKDEVAF